MNLPIQHGKFLSRCGFFGTDPYVAISAHQDPGSPLSELALPADERGVQWAFLYWSWKSTCIRPGHDLVRMGSRSSLPIGGQAVGWRRDPLSGEIDLVVYRAEVGKLLSARQRPGGRFDPGLEVRRDGAQEGESAQSPTLLILREDPGTAVTWLFDGASASGQDDRPFSGLDSCSHRGVEYVLASPHQNASTSARWTHVAMAGSRNEHRDRVGRDDDQVEVDCYDVSGCLGLRGNQTELSVGLKDPTRPQGSTQTTLVDLLWIR